MISLESLGAKNLIEVREIDPEANKAIQPRIDTISEIVKEAEMDLLTLWLGKVKLHIAGF